jgi:hypothetical protein
MAEPGDEEINGEPGNMMAANMQGPARMDPTAKLQPGMAEGKAFAEVDESASNKLRSFVFVAGRGFEQYARTARDSGVAYLDADIDGAGVINDVTDYQKTPYYA